MYDNFLMQIVINAVALASRKFVAEFGTVTTDTDTETERQEYLNFWFVKLTC